MVFADNALIKSILRGTSMASLLPLSEGPNADYTIIDDLLTGEEHSDLWEYFLQAPFHRFHEQKLSRIFGISGPEGLRGPDLLVMRSSHPDSLDNALPPTISRLADHILQSEATQQFLNSCECWNQMSLQPYIYPTGAGLTWHLDNGRAAAFIYYAHPIWYLNWGGELLVGPRSFVQSSGPVAQAFSVFDRLCNPFDTSSLLDTTGAHCVFPKPNRLVLIRGGAPHTIKKVEASAGNAFRASVAGFFSQR